MAKGRPELDKAQLLCDRLGYTLDYIYRGDVSRMPHEIAIKLAGGGNTTPKDIARPALSPRPSAKKGGGRR